MPRAYGVRMNTHDDTISGGAGELGGEPSDLGADANPFEQGTGDPTGAGTVETPNVDGGRPDGDPAAESKQTVTNDAVAGEPVEGGVKDHRGPGKIEPIGGVSDDEENQVNFTAVDGEADTVADQAEPDPDGGIARR